MMPSATQAHPTGEVTRHACRALEAALAAFDRIVGLDLADVALDGIACTRRPTAVRGPARTPLIGEVGLEVVRRLRRHGIPIGWAIDGANRNDVAHAGTHPRCRRRHRAARRHRHDPPRPRLRLPAPCATARRLRADRPRHPTTRHQGSRATSSRSGSGCAGSSRPPTHGGRTTASSAATPTAATATATPPLCLATAVLIVGKTHRLPRPLEPDPTEHLSAQVLSRA